MREDDDPDADPTGEADGTPGTDGADGDALLAAVVPKSDAEAAIERLRAEGVYDESRGVAEFDADTVALPVTDPPDSEVREVVRQPGAPRLRGLEDHLRERGWTDDELARAPSSWAVLGSVVLVEMGEAPRPGEVGEALLALHGEADTVLARRGIDGAHREPDVAVVAGTGDTETVHTEHGVRYAMDLSAVMFSPGNKAERARMAEVVREGRGTRTADRASDGGERVVDMFAGIGYFTLPMARAGARVTAVERNPTAFRYLLENVRLNGVSDRVRPYRADCREVLGVADGGTADADADPVGADGTADRVVMGYYDATDPGEEGEGPAYPYLDAALGALAPGGVMHVHEATPEALAFDRPVERVREAAAARGRDVTVLDTRRVKGYSEGVAHVVVDARVREDRRASQYRD